MNQGNVKYAVDLNFEEVKLPPFRDILVVGKNCPQGVIGLVRSFEMLIPNGFEMINVVADYVEAIFISRQILKKMSSENVIEILENNVFPYVSEEELVCVNFKINMSVNNI